LGKITGKDKLSALVQYLENKGFEFSSDLYKGYLGDSIYPLTRLIIKQAAYVYNYSNILETMGADPTIATLCQALAEENPHVRRNAVYMLRQIGTEDTIPFLLQASQDEDSDVRINAFSALKEIGSPEWLPDFSKHVLETTASNSLDYLFDVISAIQGRCGYYNYAIATSTIPQEKTFAISLRDNQNIYIQTETITMPEANNNFSGANIGAVNTGEINVQGDLNQAVTQHNYAPEQNFAEVVKEIHQLLDQLEQSSPTTTEAQLIVERAIERQPMLQDSQVIEQVIQRSPTLKQRLRSAGTAAYLEAVKMLLPPASIVIETIKAWNNPED
jgi:hypothetical protein